ncbi:MAG: hypothetical protein ACXACD_18665, partial [Candidatus Thorarchaeota archaeon]
TEDARIDYGTAADIRVTAELEYDGHVLGSADTLYMNNTIMSWVSSYFQLQPAFSQVGLWTFFVNTSGANEATYDISVVNLDGKSANQIWDRLRVISYGVTDTRCDIESVQTITVFMIYEYDGVQFRETNGVVYLNNSAMTWDSLEFLWKQERSFSSAGRYEFTVTSVTDLLHGLSEFYTITPEVIIWDSLTVSIAIDDDRINIDESAVVQVSATYDYDGSSYDGTLNLNNTQFVYSTVQKQGYTVAGALGDDSYGITVISQNVEVSCIWDSLTIHMTDPADQRIDINSNASGIVVGANYDYDGTGYDGTLTLNNTQFSYTTTQRQGYTVSGANGDDTYGITVISINDETYCIWDSLTISITDPTDQRININNNASGIVVTAIYDYDLSPYDGTFNLNDTVFMYGTVGKRGYTVDSTVGDDTHGITAISANDDTFCIWDRLQIIATADSSTPFNGVQVNFTLTVTFEYDGITCTSFEVAIARNASHWHTFTNSNKSLYFDVNSDTTYDYNASNVNSETLYGIVAFTTNTQRVSWSSKPNEIPTNDTSPDLTNADDADNMYARQRFYTIISNVSDADGYWDIDYVELTLYDNSQTQARWTIRYTVSSGLFTVPSGSEYVVLASWSSALLDGQSISITWAIKIDWDHVNLIDVDIEQFVTDGTNSDDDFYEVNWDIETRLAITGAQVNDGSGTADRGSLDGSFTYSGTATYLGSSLNPHSNETDVWVSSTEYGINIGPWSDLTLTSGTFGVTCYADDTVGEHTYTVKVVPEGQGADGSDLLQSAVQDTYIADRVQVQTYSVADDRVNVDDPVSVDVTLRYDYDDLAVLDGTVLVNGVSATHIGAGIWRVTVTESGVTANVYNLVSYSGGAHGLGDVDQNLQSQTVIWDQITVREYSVLDDRVNIGDSVDVNITIEYEYD